MADTQIASLKKVAVPSEYTLPLSAEFILKCVNADFDGSGAGGDWLPCVTIVSDSGHVIARAVDQGVKVTTTQILKANPKLDPAKLYVGQKVFIPDPNAK